MYLKEEILSTNELATGSFGFDSWQMVVYIVLIDLILPRGLTPQRYAGRSQYVNYVLY